MEELKEIGVKEVMESVHVEGKGTQRKRKDSRKVNNHNNKLEIASKGIVKDEWEAICGGVKCTLDLLLADLEQ